MFTAVVSEVVGKNFRNSHVYHGEDVVIGPMGRPKDVVSCDLVGLSETFRKGVSKSHGCNCRMSCTEHVEGLAEFEVGIAHCKKLSDGVDVADGVSGSFDPIG